MVKYNATLNILISIKYRSAKHNIRIKSVSFVNFHCYFFAVALSALFQIFYSLELMIPRLGSPFPNVGFLRLLT